MKYRRFFSALDTIAHKLTLAQSEIDIAISEIRDIKSELWGKHFNNGDNDVPKEDKDVQK